MSKFKKLPDDDFEKTRQSHLSIQRDFINKISSFQVKGFEEYDVNFIRQIHSNSLNATRFL